MRKQFLLLLTLILACWAPASLAAEPGDVLRDVPYVESGHARQKLDIYYPKSGTGPFPVVMWIHGGGWVSGDKTVSPAEDVIKRGWAAVSINYRLAYDGFYPIQIQDCKAAVRFLKTHAKEYNLDPDKIAVWGESSGGHLAALIATTGGVNELEMPQQDTSIPSTVNAVVNWNGPANFATLESQARLPKQKFLVSDQGQIVSFFGGRISRRPRQVALASPVNWASADDCQMLIVHGQKDEVVPTEQSVELYESLKKVGVPVKLELLPEGTHNLETDTNRQRALDYIAECFAKPAPARAAVSQAVSEPTDETAPSLEAEKPASTTK